MPKNDCVLTTAGVDVIRGDVELLQVLGLDDVDRRRVGKGFGQRSSGVVSFFHGGEVQQNRATKPKRAMLGTDK